MQLFDYKEKQPTPALLTTSSGQPVHVSQMRVAGKNFLNNPFVFESIKHEAMSKRPDREVLAKATGAHGYFEVTSDVTMYTKAKVFEKVGKRTPVLARMAISQIDVGASDLYPVTGKGLSFKMYTEEGNFDLLGLNIPVYFYKDPILFRDFLHSFRPNPKTNIRDPTSQLDFITRNPVSLQTMLWVFSEFGLPRGFRHMNAFPMHTFELYNNEGQSYFVKFSFITELGYKSFTLEESSAIAEYDPDLFMRDIYNSIENGNYPSWRLDMDVLSTSDLSKVNFDPFDVTRLWPNGTFTTVQVGRFVLNRNVDNHYAEVNQAAFNPTNLVPGILEPPDELFRGRVIAYHDSQNNRLGINPNKIGVNCPFYARTYNRKGTPPVLDDEGDAVSYPFNSFNGPVPYEDQSRPVRQLDIYQENTADLAGCKRFYNEVTATDEQKQRMIDNMANVSLRVEHSVIERFVALLESVDEDLAARYVNTLDELKRRVTLPQVVEDLDPVKLNPYRKY
ncbi:hypothetical protein JYU34_006531 [Plutella xylostella]|uniref:Catalase core domain-containing protein n=1 Tax=Plutella xylostella TaxID=51655 RepID=A0ABQ7QS76_PLUXY|nr:hypothetical protein JYU34_006531 [Plutella xylostella]